MSRLLIPAVILLWAANVAYVLLDILFTSPIPHSTQPLMVLGAITATILLIITHRGEEYRIGYRQGRVDADRERYDQERSQQSSQDSERV
ncbi:hypothetical protein ACQPYK_08735 [Streptosporangium sp. CA-135522]|uniref:hypothetical protein n=1 Tax=Streptosporangium sp. CA-135522 TaxID=3240072 RepID=UPI003D8EE4DA